MRHQDETLSDVRHEASALIRDALRIGAQRARLEQISRIAILHHRCNIDDVSEASGLTPKELRSILECMPEDKSEELARLAGAV